MRKLIIAAFLGLLLTGCSDRAEELYETAQFEEQQFNQDHAVKLYREIIDKYPDAAYASQARERLNELERK